jgi:hypothetical protein
VEKRYTLEGQSTPAALAVPRSCRNHRPLACWLFAPPAGAGRAAVQRTILANMRYLEMKDRNQQDLELFEPFQHDLNNLPFWADIIRVVGGKP